MSGIAYGQVASALPKIFLLFEPSAERYVPILKAILALPEKFITLAILKRMPRTVPEIAYGQVASALPKIFLLF